MNLLSMVCVLQPCIIVRIFLEFGECLCRKPGSLMIEKALARFGFDAGSSLIIGDKQRDVDAAEAIRSACLSFAIKSQPSTLLACLP